MTIKDIRNEDILTVVLEGRLDTLSAPDLDKHLQKYYPAISSLIFEMEKVDYVSSSGLRIILKAQKAMQDKGGVVIRHASNLVKGVFKVTGFLDIMHFED